MGRRLETWGDSVDLDAECVLYGDLESTLLDTFVIFGCIQVYLYVFRKLQILGRFFDVGNNTKIDLHGFSS